MALSIGPDYATYGLTFDRLAPQDPVLRNILSYTIKIQPSEAVLVYIRVSFVKFVTVTKFRAQDFRDFVLATLLADFSVAGSSQEPRGEDDVNARNCVDQLRSLCQTEKRISRYGSAVLRSIIRSSGYQIPVCCHKDWMDDLCSMLYAIASDLHYGIDVPRPLLEKDDKCCVQLITHLSLVGGRPAAFENEIILDTTTYESFMASDIPAIWGASCVKHPARFGSLSPKEYDKGLYRLQAASELAELNLEGGNWEVLDEESFASMKAMKYQNLKVFLIHERLQAFPQAIEQKAASRSRKGNIWTSAKQSQSRNSPFVPSEYFPVSEAQLVTPGNNPSTSADAVILSKAEKQAERKRKRKADREAGTLDSHKKLKHDDEGAISASVPTSVPASVPTSAPASDSIPAPASAYSGSFSIPIR